MVAKCRIRMFTDRFHQVVLLYLVLLVALLVYQKEYGSTVNAQVLDAGQVYLDQKEFYVKEIAGNATLNDGICGNLDSCSSACSRVTCYPVSGGIESLQCTSVDSNDMYNTGICPTGACSNKILLDYTRSFVRNLNLVLLKIEEVCVPGHQPTLMPSFAHGHLPALPAPASTNLQTEVARDICLQRMLDSTFKTMSFPSNYSNVYFESISGAFRSFPGRERNETQCTSFDPRKRPGYLNGISVSRDVKILVDVASSMGNAVTVDYSRPIGTTYLDVTKNITLELLDTFSLGDYVEVLSFDSGAAMSSGGAVKINTTYNYFTPNPELTGVVANLSKLTASSNTPASSDLNGAILTAASSFNKLPSLKVIIVLSNGLFVVNSTSFPSVELQNLQAKLMVYKLPTNDDGGDTYLLKTSLQKDICSVKGSFESLDALATLNPLYSMRTYFTYLARIRLAAVGNNVTWTNKYTSVLTQGRDVIAPTYPAFGSDGLLIGVAGMNVVIDNIGEPLKTLVLQDFSRRYRGTLLAPANISMTCSYQKSSANSACPGSTAPGSSAICPRNDTSSTLADRTCCGTCGSVAVAVAKRSGLAPWIVALIAIAAGGAMLAIAVAGIYYWKNQNISRYKKRPKKLELTASWKASETSRAFTYRELIRATKNFSDSELLSSGAFGDVFRGTLPSGALVAVKRIKDNNEQGEESFLAEATSLRQIRHRNLLQLRGWSHTREGLFLVYDYMYNSSLDKWIYRSPNPNVEKVPLSWSVRRFILAGVASGLEYLHEGWMQCVLHRDIKSSNVMLDADFNAYLGDFGLARLIDHNKHQRTTLLAGTLGYMAPEMIHTGRATKETDIYAFGILVLEVVCGRRPLDTQATGAADIVLLDCVWHAHEGGNICRAADARVSEAEYQPGDLLQDEVTAEAPLAGDISDTFKERMVVSNMLHLGLLCCLPNPSERPCMRVVNRWFQSSQAGMVDELPPLPVTKPHYAQNSVSHSIEGTRTSSASQSSGFTGSGSFASGLSGRYNLAS